MLANRDSDDDRGSRPALRPFLHAWLYAATTPAVPGHLDRVSGSPAARAAAQRP